MTSKRTGRRRFLKESAALAGFALGAKRFASGQSRGSEATEVRGKDLHAYGERSRFENSVRTGNNGFFGNMRDDVPKPGVPRDIGLRAPLQDSVGIITPASVHYVISHGYEPPEIDPREHRLMIYGLVDRPLILTMEELKRLPSVSRVHFIECRANCDPARKERKAPAATVQITHGFSSCSVWTGVLLSVLLRNAGVKSGASWVIAQGAEPGNHTKSIPMQKAMDDVLVAYGQNGEAVRPEQGYPLRLLVPGYEGINNVKWLRQIKVVRQPTMDKRESTDYPELRPDGKARWFNSEMGPNSVITRPSGGQTLSGRGFYEITGLAWSGGGAIGRVEVSTDGGRTWKDAQIQQPVHRKAYTRFGFGWNWNGEEMLLQSRSTDERREVQPTVAEWAKIWSLPAGYVESAPFLLGHFNVIQTWKVNRDGSIQNALFA
jgi:sulfane dehydrogenase subunit SoxC